MLKKILYILLINILIVFYYNSISYAETDVNVYLEANTSTIQSGEELQINLCISNEKTAAYNATIYFDATKFEFISALENTNIEENKINIVWYDLEGGTGAKTGKLEELTFKAKENGITDFVIEGEFFNEKGELIETNFQPIQIQIGNEESTFKEEFEKEHGNDNNANNTALTVLRTNEVGLVPEFNKDILDYDITVENTVEDLEILALAENPNAKVEISRQCTD